MSRRLLIAGFMILLFVSTNFLGLKSQSGIDFSQNQKNTLAPSTLDYLKNLPHEVSLNLLFTGSRKGLPYKDRLHHAHATRVLKEMAALSNGKLTLSFSDPANDPSAQENATFHKLTELLFSGDHTNYFGLTARCRQNHDAIPYLHPDRSSFLEYDLLQLIDRVLAQKRPTIGLISSLPVIGGTAPNGESFAPWLFVQELEQTYKVSDYSTDYESLANKPPDTLIIVHPNGLARELEPLLDQYLINGGKLILLLDAYCSVPSFLVPNREDYSDIASSTFPRLLDAWGIDFNPTEVVADMSYASEINRGYGTELLHTVLELTNDAISEEDPVTDGIDNLGFAFSGHFTLKEDHPWTKVTPLVLSSANSSVVSLTDVQKMDRNANQALVNRFVPDQKRKKLALKLEGSIPSAIPGEKRSSEPSTVFLFADSDFIFDPFAGEAQQIAKDDYVFKPYNGNVTLLANIIDSLSQRPHLSNLRKRNGQKQPLTGLAELKADTSAKHQNTLSDLQKQLLTLKQRLSDEAQKLPTEQTVAEQIAANTSTNKTMEEIQRIEARQNQIKETITSEHSQLLSKIQWLNILTIPALTLALGTAFIILRARRTRAR